MCGDFLKKRRAQRLGVYRFFMKRSDKQCCSKQSTKKRIQNSKWANLRRKNYLLKATMSQRHSNYYGFMKTGSAKVSYRLCFCCACWRPVIDLGSHFWPHWISKGVPKLTIFEKNQKKMIKRRSKKRLWKNMICWLIFDAKMRGLKL
jgi:hypothetical protein